MNPASPPPLPSRGAAPVVPPPLPVPSPVWPGEEMDVAAPLPPFASPFPSPPPLPESVARRLWTWLSSGTEWVFGLGTLLVVLAVVSVIPVLNLLCLGYLLEVSRRVSLRGRLRDGFVGVRKAAVLGRIALGTWACLLPARFLADLWHDALLIDPTGGSGQWTRLLMVMALGLGLAHAAWAAIRGGRLWHFLWPAPLKLWRWLRTPGSWAALRDRSLSQVAGLGLPGCFMLGLQGFLGAFLWMVLPLALLLLATRLPPGGAGLVSLLGSGLLVLVVMPMPYLQTHFAREGRFQAFFAIRTVRERFRRAPFAFWLGLTLTLALALPLYLFKVELTPEAIAWVPGLIFIVLGFLARLAVGWAYGRSGKRETPAPVLWRWSWRLLAVPVAAAYVFVIYFTQYVSWNGARGLLEQHAFLLPAMTTEIRK